MYPFCPHKAAKEFPLLYFLSAAIHRFEKIAPSIAGIIANGRRLIRVLLRLESGVISRVFFRRLSVFHQFSNACKASS